MKKKTLFLANESGLLKVLAIFAVALLCCLTFLLIQRIQRMQEAAASVNHSNVVRKELSQSLVHVKEAESRIRGYLLTRDNTFLDGFDEQGTRIREHLSALQKLVADDPRQVHRVDTLRRLVHDRFSLLHAVLKVHKDAATASPAVSHLISIGNEITNNIGIHVNNMDSVESALLTQRMAHSQQFINSTPQLAGTLAISSLFILLFTFYRQRQLLHISKQYLAAATTSEAEARKNSVLLEHSEEISNMGSWEWNLVTKKLGRSKNLFRLFGREEGRDITGSEPLIPQALRDEVLKSLENAKNENNKEYSFTFWATKNGVGERLFQCNCWFGKNELGEDVVIGATQDITDDYRLRQETIQRRFLVESIVENTTDLIAVIDVDLRYTVWNHANEERFGLPKEAVIGKKITDVFPFVATDERLHYIQRGLQGEAAYLKELPYLNGQRTAEFSYVPLRSHEGEVIGLLIMAHDITERRQAANLLKESNVKFTLAETAGRIGSSSWNLATNEVVWSDNLYRVFGFAPGEVKPSMEVLEGIVHPDERATFWQKVQQGIAGREFPNLYCRIIQPSGNLRFLKCSSVLVRNEKGEDVLFGSIQDVTDEQLLKIQLQERSALLESVIENSTDFISAVDAERRYILWNSAIARALQLPKEAVLGKSVLEVFPELEDKPDHLLIEEALAGNPSYNREFTFAGVSAEVSHLPLRDNDGKVNGVVILSHDITERKLAADRLKKSNLELQLRNKALQEANAFNRHITDLAPNNILVLDVVDYKPVFLNKKAKDMYGLSLEQAAHAQFDFLRHVIHPDDLEHEKEEIRKLFTATDNDVLESECRMRTRQGEYKAMHMWRAVFKRSPSGDVTHILGIAVDVTELKKAERNLRERNVELQQANEELSSFNYIASHDLQEPLRKIQVFASLLEESEENLSTLGMQNLQRIQTASKRMRTLINDLLSFSKVTLIDDDLQTVDLNDICREAMAALKLAADEKGATITADELPVLRGVRFQWLQLFENLLANAIKYSRNGVPPVISIKAETVPPGSFGLAENQTHPLYHHLRFTDNGIGFKPEYAGKIFEMFERLHSKTDYPGTGLGLAICKKVVQNHKGLIRASGRPGEGAVIDVFVPVSGVLETV